MKFETFDAFEMASGLDPQEQLDVMGYSLLNTSLPKAVTTILAPGRRRVFFLNAHCANVGTKDMSYRAAMASAEIILPDGVGVEMAAKMQGNEIIENLNGTDLTPVLLQEAAKRGMSVFMLGGTPGTADRAADNICSKIPGLRIAGTCDGYGGMADNDAVVAQINASGADILLVALGVPMQEKWLNSNFAGLNTRIALAVGGLFDFWAGNVSRAPRAIRKAKMEWVWRLAMEPRRMAKRYLIGNFAFLARAANHAFRETEKYAVTKRIIDLALSLGAMAILGPILLMVMLAIRLESPGSAVFRQTRVGKNGKTFTLYKLRSMYTDAEERRAALLATSDRKGVCFKSKSDPRVTRVGRFIRRYSLDELPQIMNVVRGEMSVVGPRPALPEEVQAYPPRALKRLSVKPGLTGLWQVSGRADIGFDQMVEMDVAYAKTQSTLLDAILIGMTFKAIFSGRGAY